MVETAERLWVAELVNTGVRNISNCMSITNKIDLCHPELKTRFGSNCFIYHSCLKYGQKFGFSQGFIFLNKVQFLSSHL